MLRSVVCVAVLASVAFACVPTTTITTTTVCCTPLTINAIPKVAPVSPISTFQQCSVLRRISSTCPVNGFLVCSAAPDTNPSRVVVQAINGAGNQIANAEGPTQATLRLFCVNGQWKTSTSASGDTVINVSCSQFGSTGRDLDNQDGTVTSG